MDHQSSITKPVQRSPKYHQPVPQPSSETSRPGASHLTPHEDTISLAVKEDANSGSGLSSLKILSYNVCSREDLEMDSRMKAIGDLIELHSPHLICFQEFTPDIYKIFCKSRWWKDYRCSSDSYGIRNYFCMQLSNLEVKSFSYIPIGNPIMNKYLFIAEVEVQGDKPLVVATSHLQSAFPVPDFMYIKERVEQANDAINHLEKNPNVIFCGDMNWVDKRDGQFPSPDGWVDAWTELRAGENGWTYDTKSNQMLSGNYHPFQERLDRFVCSLRDFKISRIEMIGTEAIPGLSYCKRKNPRRKKKLELPVLPSDHYGLLLTICRK